MLYMESSAQTDKLPVRDEQDNWGAYRQLRLPNDTSILAAAHYRKTFDRLTRDIPLNICAAWAEQPGYRHVCAGDRRNYIDSIKGQLIYYNRCVSNSCFCQRTESRRGAFWSHSQPCCNTLFRLKSIDWRDCKCSRY